MKKALFLLILTLFLFSTTIAQNSQFKTITPDFSLSTKSPFVINTGDTLLIQCDSVFLINKERYKFYKNMHVAILNENDSSCAMMLKAYEIKLTEHELSFKELLENSRLAEKTTSELLAFTKNSLLNTQNTLENTQIKLENTRKNLEIANNHIKKERWNTAGKKIMIGVGGVAVGLITGILIMR
jgi:ElaB/YqjD/DUF883 family membrane-anchored ribosome-binding protein